MAFETMQCKWCDVLVHRWSNAKSSLFNSEAKGCVPSDAIICMLLAFPAILL